MTALRTVYWESVENAELNGGEGWSPCLWAMFYPPEGEPQWTGGPMADMYFHTKEECDEYIEKYLVGASHVKKES